MLVQSFKSGLYDRKKKVADIEMVDVRIWRNIMTFVDDSLWLVRKPIGRPQWYCIAILNNDDKLEPGKEYMVKVYYNRMERSEVQHEVKLPDENSYNCQFDVTLKDGWLMCFVGRVKPIRTQNNDKDVKSYILNGKSKLRSKRIEMGKPEEDDDDIENEKE